MKAAHFYEDLTVVGADVEMLATWSTRYAEGLLMATAGGIGEGRVIYLGTYLTPDLKAALTDRLFADAAIVPLVPDLPDGVEVTMRQNSERRLLFVENYANENRTFSDVALGYNLLDSERSIQGTLRLEAYGFATAEYA